MTKNKGTILFGDGSFVFSNLFKLLTDLGEKRSQNDSTDGLKAENILFCVQFIEKIYRKTTYKRLIPLY